MKRAIYEWGWMLFAALAVCLLVMWPFSVFSRFAIEPFDLDGKTFVAVSDGTFFCSSLDRDHNAPHLYDSNFAFFYPNTVHEYEALNAGKVNLKAPGFRFRSESSEYSNAHFVVEMSLLIPASIAGIVSLTFGILLWRHHRRARPAEKATP